MSDARPCSTPIEQDGLFGTDISIFLSTSYITSKPDDSP